jgi:hypothetical protein
MDDPEKADEQVEDLDTPESESEQVKGGAAYSFLKLGDIKGESIDDKHHNSLRGGWDGNHNQTLIEI